MIQHIDDYIPPFDDAAHEREWLAQERAMRRERLQLDATGDDARSRRYRLLARALRQPLPDSLPADFAQRVAARAIEPPARFEAVLTTTLGVALGVAAMVVIAVYGSDWLPSFNAILPAPRGPASGWLLAFGGCVGASWLLGQWQRHGHR
jgi:anti-sigma factor RsiW